MAFAQYQFRRDTAANWTSANPTLLAGELGYETDTGKFKIGTGNTPWNTLAYGGLKGDTGATGAAGVSPTVTVGATTVVTPATNPSATDADAGPNADIRFSLPRARNVSAGTTTTGAAGTSASVASVQNGDGDVTLNFTIPRGDTGATGATGATGPAANSFTNIAVTGQNTVVADQANDTLTLVAGANIAITTNDTTDSVTISSTAVAQNCFAVVTGNTGTATADAPSDTLAITGGTGISTAATDTPDGLVITNTGVTSVAAGTGISVSATTGGVTISNAGVTSFNGATGAITGVNSVNGQTGAVTVNAARARIGPPVLANATTTTETVVARFAIPANFLVAGDSIRVRVLHQSAGTGTLIYRARIGAAGTIADGLLAQLTTSAAQVANAQGTADFVVYFPNTTTATGSGFAIQQAAALGTVTGAGANVTISNAAAVQLSITVQCSAAAANVTRGAHAVVGD